MNSSKPFTTTFLFYTNTNNRLNGFFTHTRIYKCNYHCYFTSLLFLLSSQNIYRATASHHLTLAHPTFIPILTARLLWFCFSGAFPASHYWYNGRPPPISCMLKTIKPSTVWNLKSRNPDIANPAFFSFVFSLNHNKGISLTRDVIREKISQILFTAGRWKLYFPNPLNPIIQYLLFLWSLSQLPDQFWLFHQTKPLGVWQYIVFFFCFCSSKCK